MSKINKIFFVILATASLFSVAYVTGLIKETRYVYDGVVKDAEYNEECLQTQEEEWLKALENTPGYRKTVPGELPLRGIGADYFIGTDGTRIDRQPKETCLIKEAVWGQNNCNYPTQRTREAHCFEIQEFSLIKTGILVLVSLTGLMYFKIKQKEIK